MKHARVIAALLLAACGGAEGETTPDPRVPVQFDQVRLDTLPDEVMLVGRLMPLVDGAATLTAPAAGVVRHLGVHVGSPVHAGATLLEIDSPELAASARQLAAAAAVAERESARQKALLADGVASAKRVDEADAAATAARANAEAATRLLARTQVQSPVAGAVQRVATREGERVDAGAVLLEVVNAARLDLAAPATAAVLSRLRAGAAATVRADGDTVDHPGRVLALSPGIDSLTNAGQAIVRVSNPGGTIRSGSAATARVRVGTRAGVLSVPEAALIVLGGTPSIFIVTADSVAHATPVEVGVRYAGRVEIRAEVKAGATVVTTGAGGLQDGMHVTAAAAGAPEADDTTAATKPEKP